MGEQIHTLGNVLEMAESRPWNSDELKAAALADLTMAWENADSREALFDIASSFGQRSSLTNKIIWSVADGIEHEELWKAEQLKPAPVAEDNPESVVTEPLPITPLMDISPREHAVREASRIWHDAIENKAVNVKASKAYRDKVIEEAKAAHLLVEVQWDTYIQDARNALNEAKRSISKGR